MQPAEIESSESSFVATRTNCHIFHSSSNSSLKGTDFPLLSNHNRMMCLELRFTALLPSAGNGPVSPCTQTAPPLSTAGCCSTQALTAPFRVARPLLLPWLSLSTGHRATSSVSPTEVCQLLSSQIMVRLNQPEVPHKELVGQCITQLNFFSCSK